MGKTHSSGIAVGDISTGIFGGAVLCQVVRAEFPTSDLKLSFNEPSLIRDVALTNDAGHSLAGTVKLGTTPGGTEIATATVTAGAATPVIEKVTGTVWVRSSVANSNVWITYATSGT